ncbi:MAG: hypothetical protein IPM86_02935 [Saprospiraceae bacterium]|nr:hypothetical protein [Saprospiraceae bacterium]
MGGGQNCNATPPINSSCSLFDFNPAGTNIGGQWDLVYTNGWGGETGQFTSWSMTFALPEALPNYSGVTNLPLQVGTCTPAPVACATPAPSICTCYSTIVYRIRTCLDSITIQWRYSRNDCSRSSRRKSSTIRNIDRTSVSSDSTLYQYDDDTMSCNRHRVYYTGIETHLVEKFIGMWSV